MILSRSVSPKTASRRSWEGPGMVFGARMLSWELTNVGHEHWKKKSKWQTCPDLPKLGTETPARTPKGAAARGRPSASRGAPPPRRHRASPAAPPPSGASPSRHLRALHVLPGLARARRAMSPPRWPPPFLCLWLRESHPPLPLPSAPPREPPREPPSSSTPPPPRPRGRSEQSRVARRSGRSLTDSTPTPANSNLEVQT